MSKNVCISIISAKLGYQVNITAIIIKSTIPYNFNCLNGGLVAVEILLSDYKETKTICENIIHNTGQDISFYSYKSSLTVVVYWCNNCGQINAFVTVSQTRCKPVYIDLCFLHMLCLENKTKCHFYLNWVLKFLKVLWYAYDL